MKHSLLVIKSQSFVLDSSFNGREPKIACFPSLCVTTRDPIICEYQTATQKNTGHSKIQLSRLLDGEISCRNVDSCFDTRMHGVPGSLSNCEIVELDLSRLMLVSTWINRSEPHRPFFLPGYRRNITHQCFTIFFQWQWHLMDCLARNSAAATRSKSPQLGPAFAFYR